jgi:hypothetical protein
VARDAPRRSYISSSFELRAFPSEPQDASCRCPHPNHQVNRRLEASISCGVGQYKWPLKCSSFSSLCSHQSPRLLRACGTMSPTTTIHQCVIPGAPRSAIVHDYSLESIAGMELDFRAALPQESPFAVGISIELAPVGPNINTLALATQDQVFRLSFQQTPSPAQKISVQRILDVQYLTGFEFPFTLVLLARTLGSNVSGYDLSTLKNGGIATPGELLSKSDPISFRSINELWDGGILRDIDAKAACTLEPDYALRAWFTAMCVTLTPHASLINHLYCSAAKMAIQDFPLGQRLSTQLINKRVRFLMSTL